MFRVFLLLRILCYKLIVYFYLLNYLKIMFIEFKKEVDIDFNIKNCCIKSVVIFIKVYFYFNNILFVSMLDCFF